MINETWKDIEEFEGIYQISNMGNIRSIDRTIICKNNSLKFLKGKMKKPSSDKDGYQTIILHKNNKSYNKKIHRLVLNAFEKNNEELQVNRINGIKSDNRLENLEWVTPKENIEHCKRTGLNHSRIGENHYSSKLTENDVIEIRYLCENTNLKHREIAEMYDLSVGHISDIKLKKAWSHI